ncbi:hypothetical protein M9458_014025, partial [Cirrhinus mrigala]
LRVYLGRRTQQGINANEVSRNVNTIINHPSYDSNTNNNDIALLRLSAPVTFTNYIRPVVFPAGTSSWITGWGDIRLPTPGILQETMVPVVANDQCNTLLGSGSVTTNMICAGLMEGGKDTCQGDSGGPMVSKQCSAWVQSGITSWGYGCADPNAPGLDHQQRWPERAWFCHLQPYNHMPVWFYSLTCFYYYFSNYYYYYYYYYYRYYY